MPLLTLTLCANSYAVSAYLPQPLGLLNVAVATQVLVLDRHYKDLRVLEDRGCADALLGLGGGKVEVVISCVAAA